jgi:hypothetical protein
VVRAETGYADAGYADAEYEAEYEESVTATSDMLAPPILF